MTQKFKKHFLKGLKVLLKCFRMLSSQLPFQLLIGLFGESKGCLLNLRFSMVIEHSSSSKDEMSSEVKNLIRGNSVDEALEPRSNEAEFTSPSAQLDNDECELSNGCIRSIASVSEQKNSVLLDQERYLPIANVVRIMKTQMDPQAKLAKDAKECVQECVSEFISFIASEAAEFCHNTKRKTITADDLLTALEATGFDNYAEPMRIFLMKYRQAHKVTGPIHKPHANYMRPKQFMEDSPIRPLFFDTEQGRRCTETQYVVNGSEVVKNAPLADEWNEQTGTLNLPKDASNNTAANSINVRQTTVSSGVRTQSTDLADTVIALEQQQQMQIYVDPTSRQHYAAMETLNGMELYPIMIQDTPVQLENVSVPNAEHVLVHLSDGSTGTMGAPSTDRNSSDKPGLRPRHLKRTKPEVSSEDTKKSPVKRPSPKKRR